MNQRLMHALLGRGGNRITIVSDGRAALEQLEREVYDVLLMDVRMPRMSGLEALALLRAREAHGARRLPVVAVAAEATAGESRCWLEAGMDGFVPKPVGFDELRRVIAGVLHANPINAAAPSLPYDRAALQRRVGRDTRLIADLCALFEPRAATLLQTIRHSIATGEAAGAAAATHELKGMLLNLAATDAAQSARALETGFLGSRFDELAPRLAQLECEVSRLLVALWAKK